MTKKIENLISYSFYSLFFLVPLAVHPKTSELFEFNKMVLTYGVTIVIVLLWVLKMTLSKKIVFRKTLLDIPLAIFILSQLISTLLSVDVRASFFGYYSRFHGGLLSTITYSLLYWAYVSNMNFQKTKRLLQITFFSAIVVSFWAILEHFGKSISCLIFPDFRSFDVSCWVQDVQNRVFATFGQPNWLAAWIVSLIPLTWIFILKSETNHKSEKKAWVFWLYTTLSCTLFITLLYTKSRSGIIAFAASAASFWATIIAARMKDALAIHELPRKIVIIGLSFLTIVLATGTPWTPSVFKMFSEPTGNNVPETAQGPALEVGGTESGEIRKIVWRGAYEMWKNHPLFGTGVETFAFSYYKHRPVEHNLVSEWNYLYNKAHNEYLNFAATTGTVGLLSYLALIVFSSVQILKAFSFPASKNKKGPSKNYQEQTDALKIWRVGIFAGFISILITNFFGFSVVSIGLMFFILPAMAVSLDVQNESAKEKYNDKKRTNLQLTIIVLTIVLSLIFLNLLRKYWYADYLYAKGKLENASGIPLLSRNTLLKAITLSSKESVFWSELADATASMAIFYAENDDPERAMQAAKESLKESDTAVKLSPKSVTLKKLRFRTLAKLSLVDISFMELAKLTLLDAAKLAPTDAHIFYNLAITQFRTGDEQSFIENLNKTIKMKPNYKEARYALAQYYIYEEKYQDAKNELNYIIQNIGPDKNIEKELADLDKEAG